MIMTDYDLMQRKDRPLSLDHLKFGTPEVMARIREVIHDTDTPSWLPSVLHNFGDASAGNLKADEWQTLSTVYFPISLVSVWGEGTTHRSLPIASSL